jgi:dihydrofolate synthase/folylpolyglutamate synthase
MTTGHHGNKSIPHTSPLAAWLSYLENLHSKTIDMGLERVSQVAARLDVLKPAPFVFTVAGTNGKGTTCRTLESVLMAAGYKVGVYSSPHLVRYTERFVQNSELPESAHTASFAEIEAARGEISLTYFEYGTLSALWLFKQAQLDVVILEVGLGGRLDATNIVDADVAVVTSIALDHIDWLGPDRESIGREKAGIFRQINLPWSASRICRTPLLTWRTKRALCCAAALTGSMRFRTTAGALATRRGRWTTCRCRRCRSQTRHRAGGTARQRPRGQRTGDPRGYTKRDSAGRFQIVSESPRLILDVAHNPTRRRISRTSQIVTKNRARAGGYRYAS